MARALPNSPELRLDGSGRVRAGVHELQAALRGVQVLQDSEAASAGVFDDATELAVRRLQWFAAHVPGALDREGRFVPRRRVPLAVDGVVGVRTWQWLESLRTRGWSATGLLVKVDLDRTACMRRGSGFLALLDGHASIGLCEGEFVPVLTRMDEAARRFGVFVFVNELFRVEGQAGSRSVVPAGSFSSHKIGRAIDLQLGLQATPVTGHNPPDAVQMQNAAADTPFGRFRHHAKARLGCRYGGDFDPVDPPHFDRQILPSGSPAWKMHYFLDQLQYRQALANPDAIPPAPAAQGAAAR